VKDILIIFVVVLLAGCASNRVADRKEVGDLWVSKGNFLEFPYYKETKELNEAYLYYLPSIQKLIYKGIKSFESYRENGTVEYTYYSGPDFFYFKHCGKP